MNKENVLLTAEAVEKSKTFNMNVPWHPNGSCGCIAGHILGAREFYWSWLDIRKEAAKRIGISMDIAQELFAPFNEWRYTSTPGTEGFIDKQHAARCLRKFAETEIVDYPGTKRRE